MGTHSKPLDDAWHVSYDQPLVTDEYLDSLIPAFARSARLAERAGFDGVDVKACHRYLASCLLSGFDRPGRYGGDYEGRTRLIRESFAAAASAVSPGFIMASRLNYYDGIELPGWGCSPDDFHQVMLDEPLRLTRDLIKEGLCLVNVTMGSPYYNPYVNRPANRGAAHPEHPLAGVRRLVSGAKAANSEVSAVATGLSWLRQYGPNLAAALVRDGWADFAGFGRMNFAYPDFPRDLKETGSIDGEKCCVGCGLCTAMMRAGGSTGCPVRDKDYYLPNTVRCARRRRDSLKTAIITGGARGIGLGIAKALRAEGYCLALIGRSPYEKVRNTVEALGEAVYEAMDIADLDSHQAALDRILAACGPIDLLVNNAGIAPKVRADLMEMTPASFDEVMAVNLRGPILYPARSAPYAGGESAAGRRLYAPHHHDDVYVRLYGLGEPGRILRFQSRPFHGQHLVCRPPFR